MHKTIDRCAATEVEPGTAQCDIDMVGALRAGWGHIDCGVYAGVGQGGTLRLGDAVTIETS